MHRRKFLAVTSVAAANLVAYRNGSGDQIQGQPTQSSWLKPTLKIGMIREGKTLETKFEIAKAAGFDGVELNAPGIDVKSAREAADATGLTIDGTVGGYHWKIRHTDPDISIREKALSQLREGIRQTAEVGGTSMLLVPGHGKDGTPEEVYDRASAAVDAALPLAEKENVQILIENVWNHFLYDHGGDSNQTAEAMAKFIDRFDSPLLAMQFDLGNHWKYGDVASWVRTLGKRISKLDIKGFSRKQGKFTAITEGDIDWNSVKAALRDVGFSGWIAAEVAGGDQVALTKVRKQMEAALDCSEVLVG